MCRTKWFYISAKKKHFGKRRQTKQCFPVISIQRSSSRGMCFLTPHSTAQPGNRQWGVTAGSALLWGASRWRGAVPPGERPPPLPLAGPGLPPRAHPEPVQRAVLGPHRSGRGEPAPRVTSPHPPPRDLGLLQPVHCSHLHHSYYFLKKHLKHVMLWLLLLLLLLLWSIVDLPRRSHYQNWRTLSLRNSSPSSSSSASRDLNQWRYWAKISRIWFYYMIFFCYLSLLGSILLLILTVPAK